MVLFYIFVGFNRGNLAGGFGLTFLDSLAGLVFLDFMGLWPLNGLAPLLVVISDIMSFILSSEKPSLVGS